MIRKAGAHRISGTHVLAAMLSFFVLVSAVDAVMIYKAVSTFGGVENPDAYREGLGYNDRIARQSRQSAVGWGHQVSFDSAGRTLSLSLRESDGRPVQGMLVRAKLGRAATSIFDFQIVLGESESGDYEAVFFGEGAGAWIADVQVVEPKSGDVVYASRSRLWRPSGD